MYDVCIWFLCLGMKIKRNTKARYNKVRRVCLFVCVCVCVGVGVCVHSNSYACGDSDD